MYYDDEARRFNFASGLLLGAILGTGLALLTQPRKRISKPQRIRQSARALRKATEDGFDRVPDSISRLRSTLDRIAR